MSGQDIKIETMNIIPLPAFRDNYIWLLHDDIHAVAVDPGDAAVVETYLAQHRLTLCAVLVTHHHQDHTGGLAALVAARAVPVFGPASEAIDGVTVKLSDGDVVRIPQLSLALQVLDVPGHTAGHIAYYGDGALFCGDTLFSAGCGRLFEGTAEQMSDSLARLAALPDATRVYCTHEYTLSNLDFARAADPDNPQREAYRARCEALRAEGRPTLPSTVGLEKLINPFLRADEAQVIDAVRRHVGRRPVDTLACFAALREWKNAF